MKTYTIILLLAAFPALASAESYVCVEEQATGFDFNKGSKNWETTRFNAGTKYLIKLNPNTSSDSKWIVSKFGDMYPDFYSEIDFTDRGTVRFISPLGQFFMNRNNLRFLRTYIAGYWGDAIPGENSLEGNNTPLIAIGKCSLLEP